MNTRIFALCTFLILFFTSCKNQEKQKTNIEDIVAIEKSFEKMVADSGIATAFHFFAADSAVIIRKTDSIIKGKERIRNYYKKFPKDSIELKWEVEFADISEDGSLAYTWGKSVFKRLNKNGETNVFKGKFHTVWKKQKDGTWKFVWD